MFNTVTNCDGVKQLSDFPTTANLNQVQFEWHRQSGFASIARIETQRKTLSKAFQFRQYDAVTKFRQRRVKSVRNGSFRGGVRQ